MKILRILGRVLVPASLVVLAACQSMPAKTGASGQSPAETSQAATPAAVKPETTLQATHHGARVAVFLADTVSQAGWTAVKITSGPLYVNPSPASGRAACRERVGKEVYIQV